MGIIIICEYYFLKMVYFHGVYSLDVRRQCEIYFNQTTTVIIVGALKTLIFILQYSKNEDHYLENKKILCKNLNIEYYLIYLYDYNAVGTKKAKSMSEK